MGLFDGERGREESGERASGGLRTFLKISSQTRGKFAYGEVCKVLRNLQKLYGGEKTHKYIFKKLFLKSFLRILKVLFLEKAP